MCGALVPLWLAERLIPEMLPMVVNACLSHGSSVMGKKQTIVKNIDAMQSFASLDVLCVDKTGTLTEDKILLEYYMDIFGNENKTVLEYAYLNSLYHSGVKNHLDSGILAVREWPTFDDKSLNLNTRKLIPCLLIISARLQLFLLSLQQIKKTC